MKQKDVHHRCRCLDRDFTFEEWCDYNKENNSTREAVARFGQFEFNVCDICLNPNVPLSFEKSPTCRFRVETAQSPNGLWTYGYSISAHNAYMGRGASFSDDPEDGFPSEREAVFDALRIAEEHTAREIRIAEQSGGDIDEDEEDYFSPRKKKKTPSALSVLKPFLNEIRKYQNQFDPRQLTLFDFL